MRRVMVNALVTLLALLLSVGASRGEENWVSCKVGTIDWSCLKIEGTEICKIKPEPATKVVQIDGKVEIPSEVTINGEKLKVVTVAKEAFQGCIGLSEVKISEGVDTIEESAFSQCEELSTLQLPQSLKVIGGQAFAWCGELKSVNIPVNVESIEYDAFQNCSKLEKFEVAAGNGHFSAVDGVLFNNDKTALLCYPLGLSADSYNIPSSVKSIGKCAFIGNGILKTVNNLDGVTAIGESAFSGCSALEKVVVPKGVTTIEPYTFNGCANLISVELSEGVEAIGEEAFSTCGSLKRVELHEGLMSIGGSAFAFSPSLSEVTIPMSVTEIGVSAFSGTGLTSVAIPAGVKRLESTFAGCGSLEKVTLSEGLEVLDGTFSGCETLTEITIPASVDSIRDYTFMTPSVLNKVYYLAAADAVVADNAFYEITATLFVRKGKKTEIEGKSWKGKLTIEERNVVTFDADGGLPTPAAQWLKDGDKAVEPSQKPEKKGFKFEGWTLLSGEVYHFDTKVEGNIALKAIYVAEYTLTITSGANGSVKVTRDNAQGDALTSGAKLQEGDKLFIAATPAEGYELEALTVNGAAHANSSVFTVGKANVEVKATFKKKGGATPPSAVESVLLAAARVVQNPIANALVLEGVGTAERIEVYSLTGVQTYAGTPRGEERVEISTGSWASGTYVVRIIAADGEKTVKVVKR